MQIVANEESLRHYLQTAVEINTDQPVLVDKYIMGKELEVDAICDGTDVFIPGIMEHVERTGVHSGDSISIYPTFSVSQAVRTRLLIIPLNWVRPSALWAFTISSLLQTATTMCM